MHLRAEIKPVENNFFSQIVPLKLRVLSVCGCSIDLGCDHSESLGGAGILHRGTIRGRKTVPCYSGAQTRAHTGTLGYTGAVSGEEKQSPANQGHQRWIILEPSATQGRYQRQKKSPLRLRGTIKGPFEPSATQGRYQRKKKSPLRLRGTIKGSKWQYTGTVSEQPISTESDTRGTF
jgi:hypothetical protein